MYDYCRIDPAAISRAQRSSEAALRSAGIELRWRTRAADPAGRLSGPVEKVVSISATVLDIMVLPETMSRRMAIGPRQFGTSVISNGDRFATHAYVYFDRIA